MTTNPTRGKSSVRPFRVPKELLDLGLVDPSPFVQTVDRERALNASLAAKETRLRELREDRTIDPLKASKEAATLRDEIEFLKAAAEEARREGDRARHRLNDSVCAALCSPEALARAEAIDLAERNGGKASEVASAINSVRAILLDVGADRRFRAKVLGARRAELTRTRFDGEEQPVGLDAGIEHALEQIATALVRYPGASIVRHAITRESDWHRVDGISTNPNDYPKALRDQICTGMDSGTIARWLRSSPAPVEAPAPDPVEAGV